MALVARSVLITGARDQQPKSRILERNSSISGVGRPGQRPPSGRAEVAQGCRMGTPEAMHALLTDIARVVSRLMV